MTDQGPGDWTGSGFDATKFTTYYGRTDPGPGDDHVLEPRGGGAGGGHDEGRGGVLNGFRSRSPPASESSRYFPSHSCSPRRGSPPFRRMEGSEGTPLRILERRDRTPPLGDEDEVLCIEEHLSDNGEGKTGPGNIGLGLSSEKFRHFHEPISISETLYINIPNPP